MPRRNSPPTPTTPTSPNLEASDPSDFVILARPSLNNINHMTTSSSQQHVDLQLQSQLSPPPHQGLVDNGGGGATPNMVTTMQYDQLINTARRIKDENSLLKTQLTEMMQTMEARTKEFLEMKDQRRKVADRFEELRNASKNEITRLRNEVKTSEDRLQETIGDQKEKSAKADATCKALEEKLSEYEAKIHQLEEELKEKTEEVMVSYEPGASDFAAEDASLSLLRQLKADLKNVQGTRADIQHNVAELEEALQKSTADLKRYKQQAVLLAVEKQDLVALNNELQTKAAMYSIGGHYDTPTEKTVSEVGSLGVTRSPTLKTSPCPGQAMQKSSIALQDVLLQLQSERDKVDSLMKDLKREQQDRNKVEAALMEQIHTRSGEHDIAVQELTKNHEKQVEELIMKVDELTVANQEPHHSLELKHQVRSLVCELQERETTQQQQEKTVAELRNLNEALKSKISLYHDELEKLRREDSRMIATLQEELKREQVVFRSEKQKLLMERESLEQLKEEYNQLFQDYDELVRSNRHLQERSVQGVNATALRELAEQRDNLTAQLVSAEEAIGAKQAELEKAQKEMREAKAELETVPVLQAQAEIYKNDFDAERAAREKAHSEREAMMVDIQMLKDENQRLQEQVAGYSQAQLQQMQHRHTGTGIIDTLYEHLPFFKSQPQPKRDQTYPYHNVSDDEEFVMAEPFSPGTNIDKVPYGGPDEAGTGVVSPGLAGNDQTPVYPRSQPIEPVKRPNCPMCEEDFPDIDTLQIHMLDCIK